MRRQQNFNAAPVSGWLVTFADIITLLVTFFVLLISMSSFDEATLTRIAAYNQLPYPGFSGAAGRIPERIREVVPMLRDPESVFVQQERIKDLLFPDDILPSEMLTEIKDQTEILAHPEGVVIVLSAGLLFPENSARLTEPAKKLLEALTPVILAVNSDVNVSGYTDTTPARGTDNYHLSFSRSLAVLEYFLHGKVHPDRFSVSGYGSEKAVSPNSTDAGRRKNRRVEILLKTTRWLGSYT